MSDNTTGQSQAQNGDATPAQGSQTPNATTDQSGGSNPQQANQQSQYKNVDLTQHYRDAYNDGFSKREAQILRELNVNSVDELKALKEKSTKKPELTPEQISQHPAFVELQTKATELENSYKSLEAQLRTVNITNHLTMLAKNASAADPDYARYKFLETHKVDLDKDGKPVVQLLDGTPIVKLNEQNQPVKPTLDEAFNEWFAKQTNLKATSNTQGANSTGNKTASQGVVTGNPFDAVKDAAKGLLSPK